MSDSLPKRPLRPPSQTANAEFNWPPTDEELAAYFYSDAPDEPLAQFDVNAEPTMGTGRLAPLETSAGQAGTVAPEVGFDRPPADSEKSEVQDPEYGGSTDPTTSDIAVITHEAALDGATNSTWTAEIARLQALIEALTEKVEWRIPNATRR